jgi:hypothetical protein
MDEALVIHEESMPGRTPLRVRLRWALCRTRAAVLPRRRVIPWEMRDNSRHYAQAVAEARARNASSNDIHALEAEAAHFYWELEEELEMLESGRLLKEARKFMLPTPELPAYNPSGTDDDPNWRHGTTVTQSWYLKRGAMLELRAKIRAERKARLEPITESVKLFGAIIGGAGGAAYLAEKLIGLMHR